MSEKFLESSLKTYYSDDETELYVLTGPLPRLQLKEAPDPSDAPLYIDIEAGEAYHPEQVSTEDAREVARYAAEDSAGNPLFELHQDTERWHEEFSELFGQTEIESVDGYSVDLDERPDAGSPRQDSNF
ncbi:MAG: hypothetical protein ABEK10_00605 [Candidatus Nanosalina sp.]